MDFVYDLTIPADTAATSPTELELPSIEGIVTQVEIEIPPGPKGGVYCAIRQGSHQVWPTNPEGAFRSDGRVYSAREHYEIVRGAPVFVLQGWSPGTTYEHTVQFRLIVLPKEVAEPWREQVSVLGRIARALGVRQ